MLGASPLLAALLTFATSAALAAPGASGATMKPGCNGYYRRIFQSMRGDVVPLSPGSQLYRTSSAKTHLRSEELGRLLRSDHPEVQAAIDELAELGGELRLRVTRLGISGPEVRGRSHFRYDPHDGIPVISIDPDVDLDVLDHELQHFRDWKHERERLVRSGLDGEALEAALLKIFSEPEDVQSTERKAVGAQLRSQARMNQALSTPRGRQNSVIPSRALPAVKLEAFVSLITYPEREALLRVLSDGLGTRDLIPKLMDEAVRKGLALRKAAHRRASENLRRMTEKNVGNPAMWEQMETRVRHLAREDLLFDGIFNEGTMEDFAVHKDLLRREFDRALERRHQR